MVNDLLDSIPRLWRGSRMPTRNCPALPTGFRDLDGALPGGGWPVGAVVELLMNSAGIGELRLLLPLIRQLALSGNHVLLIHPPYSPNAVLLQRLGIDLGKLLVIHPRNEGDALWSAEQALRNPGCGAVLIWPRGSGRVFSDRQIRRLQVASAEGQSTLFLYRAGVKQASRWAALRLELLPAKDGLQVSVLKATGTHRRPVIILPLPLAEADRSISP